MGNIPGKEKEPTIILEPVASHNIWFWYAFFGLPGTHNSINILNPTPLFKELLHRITTIYNFKINDWKYDIWDTTLSMDFNLIWSH